MDLILTENQAGKPIQINDMHLTPIEKFTRIQPPGMWGALIWLFSRDRKNTSSRR